MFFDGVAECVIFVRLLSSTLFTTADIWVTSHTISRKDFSFHKRKCLTWSLPECLMEIFSGLTGQFLNKYPINIPDHNLHCVISEKTLTWMVPRRSRSLRLCFALQCSLAKHSILEYSVCRKYVANMLIGLDCYIIHFIMHFSTYAHFWPICMQQSKHVQL